MHLRLPRSFAIAAFGIAVLGVAACGGGGGGSSPSPIVSNAPTSTPTIAPTVSPTATSSAVATSACSTVVSNAANCTYSIASNPEGIAVSVNNAKIGVTPTSTAPPFSVVPLTLTFANSTYSVTINQTGGATRTIFYNSVSDTGNVQMTGNQSVARTAAAVSRSAQTGPALNARSVARFNQSPAISAAGVYVRYDSSKIRQTVQQIEANAGARTGVDILSSVAATRGRVVYVQPGTDVRTLASRLLAQPGVTVYPLHYRVPVSTPVTLVPLTDAEFGVNEYQWDLDEIQARYAWSLTTSRGSNAKIAIIDTGVDLTHPDLAAKIKYQATFVDGAGYVNTTGANSAQDTNGHGTNVAGIAAAQANDATGFAGVGYNAQIWAYRIFPNATSTSDDQSADTGDEAAAIADAVAQHVDVINLSLGSAQNDPTTGSGFDQSEHDAVEAAIAAGVTVVAAAGNGDSNNVAQPTIDFPGAYDGVISVGASAIADNDAGTWNPASGAFANAPEVVASYSNYGPGLSVVAPGGDTSTSANSDASNNLHWIVNDSSSTAAFASDQCKPTTLPQVCGFKFQGTSQATPHVTGTVALVQSALREKGMSTLSPSAMLQLIEGTADNIGSPYQGHGRLNALRALAGALGVQTVNAPAVPASTPAQFVAFAYTNIGNTGTKPVIVDQTYPNGQLVSSTGAFRIADVDPSKTTGAYRIAVWLDANGDGVVDAGDQFGASSVTCTANAACNPGTIAVSTVPSGFTLP
jgi:subtilisin family serine protease